MSTPTTWRDQELHRLIDTAATDLAAAWTALTAAQADLLAVLRRSGGTRGRAVVLKAALARFNRSVAAFDVAAVSVADRWASTELAIAYRHGAEAALRSAPLRSDLPVPVFAWSDGHQAAVRELSAGAYESLVRRINETVRRARVFVRAASVATRNPRTVDPGQLARTHPLNAVVYADSSHYPAAAWARTALVAQAATAANTAAVHTAADLGAEWVQVEDGPECGWTGHADPDRAHGTLREVGDAAVHVIGHPGCIRSLIPRPDLTGRTDIDPGQAAGEEEDDA
ncbi:hypothetical protein OG618_37190 (plasmid) [Kitasatospora sp. NBC_01246]|uniref:hypothetical protein n=1 Tax=Kitasatospora sp. NBC_01246 TaxID=2903570 RepID=UPI002E3142E0|nr:hypothetical protein [Kitasatospora sp. NBC_01246]